MDSRNLTISTFLISFLLTFANLSKAAAITAAPNTIILSNTVIDVGQMTVISNLTLLGGLPPYETNWIWVPPSNSNLGVGNSILTVPTGNLTKWTQVNTMPYQNELFGCPATSNAIYCIAGDWSGPGVANNVIYSQIVPNGLGTWSSSTTGNFYPSKVYWQSCFSATNNIYCVGGVGGAANVYYAPIIASNVVGTWTSSNSYPLQISEESCTTTINAVYCIDGFNAVLGEVSNVYYAALSPAGVSTWITGNAYPINVAVLSCGSTANTVYCVGGVNGLGTWTSSVYFAPILSNNALGAWTLSSNSYPTVLDNAIAGIDKEGCTITSNTIYCVGGVGGSGKYTPSAYYASLLTGDIGAWQSTNAYPFNAGAMACSNSANVIYCAGGDGGTSGIYLSGNVYYTSPAATYAVINQTTENSLAVTTLTGKTYFVNAIGINIIAGSWTINSFANDTINSNTVTFSNTLVINTAPTVSLNVVNIITDTGQIETLEATVSGGTGPFTVNFFNVTGSSTFNTVTGVALAGTASNSFVTNSPVSNNVFSWNVIAVDTGTSTPVVFNSITKAFTVNSLGLATPTISLSSSSVTVGQSVTITASASGGSSPYTYNFVISSGGSDFASSGSQASSSYIYTTTSAGSYGVNVIVTDTASQTANSVLSTLTVTSSSTGGGGGGPQYLSVKLTDSIPNITQSNIPVFTAYILNISNKQVVSTISYNQAQLPVIIKYRNYQTVNFSFACIFSAGSATYLYQNDVYGIGLNQKCNANFSASPTTYNVIYSVTNSTSTTTATTSAISTSAGSSSLLSSSTTSTTATSASTAGTASTTVTTTIPPRITCATASSSSVWAKLFNGIIQFLDLLGLKISCLS